MTRQVWALSALCIVLAAGQVAAHHAFSAEFDANQPITLTGKLTKMEWTNPHGWLHIDAKQPDGSVQSWMGETGAPNALVRRGWTKSTLPPGIEVVVQGYRAKDGTRKMTAMSVVLPDGKKLFAGSSGVGAPPE